MKKILTIIIIFLFALNLPAQQWLEGWKDDNTGETWSTETMTIDEWKKDEKFHGDWKADEWDEEEFTLDVQENEWTPESAKEKKPFRMPKRVFEFGLLELDVGFANNFMGVSDILKKKLVLDFANFNSDFNIGFDIFLRPVYWNVSIKDDWGFGMDFGKVTAYGNVSLAEDLMHFRKTSGASFGAGAAVFADVGVPIFFSIKNVWENRKLKINVRPAGFVTAAYVEPQMNYKFVDVNKDGTRGSYIEVDYGFRAYTPFSLEDIGKIMDTLDISSALGFDISVGADYPLFKWVDVGVQFINIPLSPSRLRHYMELKGKATVDTSKVSIDDLINGVFPDDIYTIPDNFDFNYGEVSNKAVSPFFRPFKMLLTADFYPLFNRFLIVSPVLGFSINTLFVQPGAIEIGVKVSTDLANMFIPSISIFYEDQMWKNKFDFVFNLRAFQLNLGIALQSQDFAKSWTGAGLRVNVGLIFGW